MFMQYVSTGQFVSLIIRDCVLAVINVNAYETFIYREKLLTELMNSCSLPMLPTNKIGEVWRKKKKSIFHRVAGFLDFSFRPEFTRVETRRFGNYICSRLKVKGGKDTYSVGPLRKRYLNHLKTETDPVYETSCFYSTKHRTREKVQKPSNSVCYTPLSEPYKIYYPFLFLSSTHVALNNLLSSGKSQHTLSKSIELNVTRRMWYYPAILFTF
jgi:hypothetical protein